MAKDCPVRANKVNPPATTIVFTMEANSKTKSPAVISEEVLVGGLHVDCEYKNGYWYILVSKKYLGKPSSELSSRGKTALQLAQQTPVPNYHFLQLQQQQQLKQQAEMMLSA
ncbi:Uncharacterized protein Fot_21476 [Forsythia ovata]|uniref:Uncharacterized protein n=1 Tax=Forsythia ovata TaxID=205694 RepID=A0ABD1UWI9_9LAMI